MRKYFTLIVFVFLMTDFASSQGCSDAGVCSTGNLSSALHGKDQGFKNDFSMGYQFGISEGSTRISSLILEGNFSILKTGSLQLMVPYHLISGKLAKVSGLGDVMVSISGKIFSNESHQVGFMAGTRLPMNESDEKSGILPLPMVYQTSLGTADLLVGIKYSYKNWMLTMASQFPFIQNNRNGFLKEFYSDSLLVKPFSDSKELQRKPDIVLKVEHAVAVEKVRLVGTLLTLYHTGKDEYIDSDGFRKPIDGSEGFTINCAGSVDYMFTEDMILNFYTGFPLKIREERPDGLARKLVCGIKVRYTF